MEEGDQDLLFLLFTSADTVGGPILDHWVGRILDMLEDTEVSTGRIAADALDQLGNMFRVAPPEDPIAKLLVLLAGLLKLEALRNEFYQCCPYYKIEPLLQLLEREFAIYMDGLGEDGGPHCIGTHELKYPDATAFVSAIGATYIAM